MSTVVNGASTLVSFVQLDAGAHRSSVSTSVGRPPAIRIDPTSSNTAAADAGVGADGGVGKPPRPRAVSELAAELRARQCRSGAHLPVRHQLRRSRRVRARRSSRIRITLEVSMPARIVVGPVDSLAQVTTGTPTPPTYEVPYIFVVDQHRLGRAAGRGTDARPAPAHQSSGLRRDRRIRADGLPADLRGLQRQRRPLPDPVSLEVGARGRATGARAAQTWELDAAQVRVETTCR